MPHTDLPLEELRRYTPDLPAPDDLQEFWDATLQEAGRWPLDASWAPWPDAARTWRTVSPYASSLARVAGG